MIDSQTIPAWFVALLMISTGLMWIIAYKRKIRLEATAFALTFILQGIAYLIIYQILNVNIEIRGFFSRLLISMLCLSQLVPLIVSYIRSFKRER